MRIPHRYIGMGNIGDRVMGNARQLQQTPAGCWLRIRERLTADTDRKPVRHMPAISMSFRQPPAGNHQQTVVAVEDHRRGGRCRHRPARWGRNVDASAITDFLMQAIELSWPAIGAALFARIVMHRSICWPWWRRWGFARWGRGPAGRPSKSGSLTYRRPRPKNGWGDR